MSGPQEIEVMRPRLPSADEVLPYLRRIDLARVYSNFGPLYHEFTERLAAHFGVEREQVALVANGTLALQAAVETVGDPGDTWICPSWTFVATGQALLAARRRIHFVDVDPNSWEILPTGAPFARGRVVVAPFGSAPPSAAWSHAPGHTILDAASCFDSAAGIGPSLGPRSILMVSLHATKPMGVGEGAVLVGPRDWIRRASVWANFGFDGSRVASGPGLNAKFSEYQSAVGLAGLDRWPSERNQWEALVRQACEVSSGLGLEVQPSFRTGWITSTWNVELPEGVDSVSVAQVLSESSIATRSWWPQGVHSMPAFLGQTHAELATTESLVRRVIGLPFGHHMDERSFGRVRAALGRALAAQV